MFDTVEGQGKVSPFLGFPTVWQFYTAYTENKPDRVVFHLPIIHFCKCFFSSSKIVNGYVYDFSNKNYPSSMPTALTKCVSLE